VVSKKNKAENDAFSNWPMQEATEELNIILSFCWVWEPKGQMSESVSHPPWRAL
jgi:hypothetical protein